MKSVNDAADLFLSKTLILLHVLHLTTMQLFRTGIKLHVKWLVGVRGGWHDLDAWLLEEVRAAARCDEERDKKNPEIVAEPVGQSLSRMSSDMCAETCAREDVRASPECVRRTRVWRWHAWPRESASSFQS